MKKKRKISWKDVRDIYGFEQKELRGFVKKPIEDSVEPLFDYIQETVEEIEEQKAKYRKEYQKEYSRGFHYMSIGTSDEKILKKLWEEEDFSHKIDMDYKKIDKTKGLIVDVCTSGNKWDKFRKKILERIDQNIRNYNF